MCSDISLHVSLYISPRAVTVRPRLLLTLSFRPHHHPLSLSLFVCIYHFRICVAADKNGDFCAVSIYNVPSDALHLNDQLTVIDPEQTDISLTAGEQSWGYSSLTVHEPMSVIRNRQHQMGEMFAESRLSLQTGT
eukprot:TRINITY_DN2101_c1_g1_i12.p1 TRINITY_DN2101_c1_g1~~TRINITY_DN2101_c1_g1_i12.p1  ORF type:complete len:135 (-),score=13.74 TRINITY_DN2101_c1_g1_i12:75-479(-)